MLKEIRFLAVYAACAGGLALALQPSTEPFEPSVPLLPAEAVLAGTAATPEMARALRADAFRWLAAGGRAPVWRRGLTVDLIAEGPDVLRAAVLERGRPGRPRPVWSGTFKRAAGREGEAVTAAVVARLLWAEPAVGAAAERAFLDNQADVARAGSDLWRSGRWAEAAETLALALENDWGDEAQAQLHFGLADAYAHLGRPRQAFWHALAYLAHSRSGDPPRAWVTALRGAAGLLAEQPATVEPQAQEAARRRAAAQGGGSPREAFEELKRLCRLAPWADAYQQEAAAVYDKLGWKALAESWRRRAEDTRRLASDEALQRRLSALTR